jgi:hypothetical protein|tara:strand:+ start:1100 stop:1393 length:294 start_codon:yes stop_codon:yes gene_type:complete
MKNLRTKLNYILGMLLITLLLTGCADVSPHTVDCITSNPYGFFGGLWHGVIIVFSWVGSLFSDDIAIYAYNNNGGWYDFGFLLGIGGLTSGSFNVSK